MININRQAFSFDELFESVTERKFIEKINSSLFDDMNYVDSFDFVYRDNENVLDSLVSVFKNVYGCDVYRVEKNNIYIFSKDFMLSCEIRKSVSLSSVRGTIRTSDIEFIDKVKNMIKNNIDLEILNANIFSLDWYFMTHNGPTYSSVKGIASDILLDKAYPNIDGGIENFINKYLDSDESVLILTGPPGTGKTWYAHKIARILACGETDRCDDFYGHVATDRRFAIK